MTPRPAIPPPRTDHAGGGTGTPAPVRKGVGILGVGTRRRGVAITRDLAPALLWSRGDPVPIRQVVVNPVRDAFEALADSQSVAPTVVIGTRAAEEGGRRVRRG